MTRLTPETRDAIDAALVDVYRAAWSAGLEPQPELLRAAYLMGRVDQELGRPIGGINESINPTERSVL